MVSVVIMLRNQEGSALHLLEQFERCTPKPQTALIIRHEIKLYCYVCIRDSNPSFYSDIRGLT
jgi:hypothetical protein